MERQPQVIGSQPSTCCTNVIPEDDGGKDARVPGSTPCDPKGISQSYQSVSGNVTPPTLVVEVLAIV